MSFKMAMFFSLNSMYKQILHCYKNGSAFFFSKLKITFTVKFHDFSCRRMSEFYIARMKHKTFSRFTMPV